MSYNKALKCGNNLGTVNNGLANATLHLLCNIFLSLFHHQREQLIVSHVVIELLGGTCFICAAF